MQHYHYIFIAHNGIIPDRGLLEPVTLDLTMKTPDLVAAQDKATSLVARDKYQLERIYEHHPDLEGTNARNSNGQL